MRYFFDSLKAGFFNKTWPASLYYWFAISSIRKASNAIFMLLPQANTPAYNTKSYQESF
jgi:hypothetical protein